MDGTRDVGPVEYSQAPGKVHIGLTLDPFCSISQYHLLLCIFSAQLHTRRVCQLPQLLTRAKCSYVPAFGQAVAIPLFVDCFPLCCHNSHFALHTSTLFTSGYP